MNFFLSLPLFFFFFKYFFIMLLWSLCEFQLVNPSPALKIMEKAKEIRKKLK